MGYAERLLATYPHATHAVAWVELILCRNDSDDEEETGWEMMMRATPPMSLDEVKGMIRTCLEEEIQEGSPGKHREALAEIDTPDFTRYLRGKMGFA